MILVEAGQSLLAGLPPKMGEYSRRMLERRGVEVLLGDGVAGADELGLTLQSGRRIETETIVWSAGVKPSPTIASIGAADDEARRGRHRARHARARIRRRVGARRLRRDSGRSGRRLSDDGAARDSRRAAAGRQHRRRTARQAYEAVSLSRARHDGGAGRPQGRRAAARRTSSSPASSHGSFGARTTCCVCRGSTESCASPSTGRSNCSFRATPRSCASASAKARKRLPRDNRALRRTLASCCASRSNA